jgi:hypothetical protein
MDCHEIKKLLDQYIENDLSKDASGAVRKHLPLCKNCGAELALLKKYRKEMASLKEAKAPADFLQQLNLRIDKQASFKKILRTLFFPLKVKVPIEALGVLTTVVLIVLLINPADQIKESTHVAGKIAFNEKPSEVRQEAKIADVGLSARKTGKAGPALSEDFGDDRILTKADRKSISVRGETVKTRDIVLALHQVKPSAASDSFRSMAPPVSMPQAEESAEVNAINMKKDKAAGARPEKDRYADSTRSEKFADAEKGAQVVETKNAQKSNVQKTQDESINRQVVILQPIDDIKRIAVSLNGKVIKEVLGKDDQVQYIIIDIQAGNQQEFLDKLSKLGSMQSREKKPADISKSDKVRFRIKIKQME